jgi:hypothetical protein
MSIVSNQFQNEPDWLSCSAIIRATDLDLRVDQVAYRCDGSPDSASWGPHLPQVADQRPEPRATRDHHNGLCAGTAAFPTAEEFLMSDKSTAPAKEDTPTYITRFDGVRVPASEYRQVWLESLADDVTIEGSAMTGVAQGADAVRSIVTTIRTLYDSQEFNFAGPYGENGFLEDYTAWVGDKPIGNVVLVARNAAGQAQHIVANYRPRDSLLNLSRLIGEHLAGTPYAKHFATSDG